MAQEGKLKTKLLLIGVRTAASVFLHATFESKTLLGDILIEGVSTSVRLKALLDLYTLILFRWADDFEIYVFLPQTVESRQHALNHKTNKLYAARTASNGANGEEEVLVFVSQVSTPESLNRLVKCLYDVVSEVETTIVFDTIPSSTYLAGTRFSVPTVRLLATRSANTQLSGLPHFLEAPVLIEGVTAGVIQYCQLRKKAAYAYISLEDDLYLEAPTIIAWEPYLKLHVTHPTSSTSYNALLKKVVTHRPNSLFA